ncbi:MAG: phosphoribosylanthranilate isomerase [Spirulina sp. DLM2.Bin59]|nr:MAG: phosphoribosylanthranilate isomerase [Spirulina sp. DLM2.Bin59]
MEIKICGITQPQQGAAIARLGATALGLICAPQSPRYVTPAHIATITQGIPQGIERIGVFVDASLATIAETVTVGQLTGVQLHGQESPAFCQTLREQCPQVMLWKAFRVRSPATLATMPPYYAVVDALLLDAYHPHLEGGTGHTLNWQDLQTFTPPLPWFLAGGLNPDNIATALTMINPAGVDVSSGVERSPGDKDLDQVKALINQIRLLSKS